jgi:NAD(P)H-dependent FMN reductase
MAIITYGGHGGDRCARQLRQIAVALKMRVVARTPALRLSDAVIREGEPLVPERDFLRWQPHVRHALSDLTALAQGRESAWARVRRVWKSWMAVL